jgi:hypothetical protein
MSRTSCSLVVYTTSRSRSRAAEQGCTHANPFFHMLQGLQHAPEDCEMFLAMVPQQLANACGCAPNVITYENSQSYPAWRVAFRVWPGVDADCDVV